jgi:serine-type D-Ala-D-Ala carboxypeptidase/endopeptidase (penicillin-binding protein 4)
LRAPGRSTRRLCGFSGLPLRSAPVASLARVARKSLSTRPTAALLAALALTLAAPAAAPASPESGLRKSLSRAMSHAGSYSGAYVRNAETGHRLFAVRRSTPRILASNTKLFTIGAALGRYGPDGTLVTRVLTGSPLDAATGIVDGNLYFVGGGDPVFGGGAYVRSAYGGRGATVEKLAKKLYDGGLRVVRGRVVGDESLYDSRRSGPAEGYAASGEVGGPLSALVFNHGLMSTGRFQTDPPSYAAGRLTDALQRLGVKVSKSARSGRAPSGAVELASIRSMAMSRIAQLTALPSDNFFAELLAKGLGDGTTAGGARSIVRFAHKRGAEVHLSDGSGLSRSNQAAPQDVVRFLDHERDTPEFDALYSALPIAGVNGTLFDRMRSGPAHHHCRAKTGTLSGVSALSGYCESRGGSTLIFSILMNGQGSDSYAHSIQDKMAQSMAKYKG